MSGLITCGLGELFVYAEQVPFTTEVLSVGFDITDATIEFAVTTNEVNFDTDIPRIEFSVDIIVIEGC